MPHPVARAKQACREPSKPPEFMYEPQRCAFLRQHVWAICVRQPDGLWDRVNCLDKDAACFGTACVFAGGANWPFAGRSDRSRTHG